MTPCTTSTSDATNWHSRLSALEGLMAQVVIILAKNNVPIVIGKRYELVRGYI
jgi:hypothetical protein